MGSSTSRERDLPPSSTVNAQPESVGPAEAKKKEEESKKVDYMNLPCPTPYEQLDDHEFRILKLIEFEGLGVQLKNRLNKRFLVTHTYYLNCQPNEITMDSREVPYSHGIVKVSKGNYSFGALFNDPKFVLYGEMDTYGTLEARVKYNFTNNFCCLMIAKITNGPRSDCSFSFAYKGKDFQSRFHFGPDGMCTANYIQSVTPNLSLGTEVIWHPYQTKSTINFAARYNTNKVIATGQVWNNGEITSSYVQNLSEKASLASEFKCDPPTGSVIWSAGYEYKFRECLLRGKMDMNGVISAYLEKKIFSGIQLMLFAKIDHKNENYKSGYSLTFDPGPE